MMSRRSVIYVWTPEVYLVTRRERLVPGRRESSPIQLRECYLWNLAERTIKEPDHCLHEEERGQTPDDRKRDPSTAAALFAPAILSFISNLLITAK